MKTLYSDRLDSILHLGKKDAEPLRSGVVRYDELRPALERAGVLPTMPQMFGHGHDLPQGSWLMLGNGPLAKGEGTLPEGWTKNGCGDCTIADAAHEAMEAAINGKRPVPKFSAKTVIEQYMERTKVANGAAYDPKTEEGDTGLQLQDVNEWRVEEGVADDEGEHHKILDVISIEPGNVQHIWEAAFLFEKVTLGIVVCEAQMDQFDAGPQPTWDYVKGSPEAGGHAVPIMGKLGLISWAEDVYYTPRFIEKQNDEAYTGIDPQQFEAVTGDTLERYKQADLEKFAVELAKQKVAQ